MTSSGVSIEIFAEERRQIIELCGFSVPDWDMNLLHLKKLSTLELEIQSCALQRLWSYGGRFKFYADDTSHKWVHAKGHRSFICINPLVMLTTTSI